jgi:hypothetical protein
MANKKTAGRRVQVNFDIDAKLHRKFKLYAFKHGVTIKSIFIDHVKRCVAPETFSLGDK